MAVQVRACLTQWSSMSVAELYDAHFAEAAAGRDAGELQPLLRKAAAWLHLQATALATLGFENALDNVTVANSTRQVPLRNGFPKLPPCCALRVVPEKDKQHSRPYECAPGGEATLPADYKYIGQRA